MMKGTPSLSCRVGRSALRMADFHIVSKNLYHVARRTNTSPCQETFSYSLNRFFHYFFLLMCRYLPLSTALGQPLLPRTIHILTQTRIFVNGGKRNCELKSQMRYCNVRWTCVASGVANRDSKRLDFIGFLAQSAVRRPNTSRKGRFRAKLRHADPGPCV